MGFLKADNFHKPAVAIFDAAFTDLLCYKKMQKGIFNINCHSFSFRRYIFFKFSITSSPFRMKQIPIKYKFGHTIHYTNCVQ